MGLLTLGLAPYDISRDVSSQFGLLICDSTYITMSI